MNSSIGFIQKNIFKIHNIFTIILIIMYIYQALINALSAHIIQTNLYTIFYTHAAHSPTKTIYIKQYIEI